MWVSALGAETLSFLGQFGRVLGFWWRANTGLEVWLVEEDGSRL
jgi:hypothetical protein